MYQQSGEIEVPVFLTGNVTSFEGVDICSDNANYRLHTAFGEVRLRPGNETVEEFLLNAAGNHTWVTVAGYHVAGTEGKVCDYIDVYSAWEAEEFGKQMNVSRK